MDIFFIPKKDVRHPAENYVILEKGKPYDLAYLKQYSAAVGMDSVDCVLCAGVNTAHTMMLIRSFCFPD